MSNLFESGNILFVKNFQYSDGGKPTDKIIIILETSQTSTLILQAKTTSTVSIPEKFIRAGCTNNKQNKISFFMFAKNVVVGKKKNGENFSFDCDTYIYHNGNNIFEFDSMQYLKLYQNSTTLLGRLNNPELLKLVLCAIKSQFTITKIKKYLTTIKSKLSALIAKTI